MRCNIARKLFIYMEIFMKVNVGLLSGEIFNIIVNLMLLFSDYTVSLIV